jgi:hypothetical protein
VIAAIALGVFASTVTIVCLPVLRVVRRARARDRWAMFAAVAWFPAVVWADVAVVATASWRRLDALGAALLVGVLAQAIAAALAYLRPNSGRSGRNGTRCAGGARPSRSRRVVAWNAGALVVVAAAVAGAGPVWGWVAWAGWVLVLTPALVQAISIVSVRRARGLTPGR